MLLSAAEEGTIKPDLLGTNPLGENALALPASRQIIAAENFILSVINKETIICKEDLSMWVT